MSSEPLQEAYRLIRAGSPQEAVRILVPLVRADPLSADAWWLLANAVENREQKRQALERVLKLRPGDTAAQTMLDQFGGATPAKVPRTARVAASVPPAAADEEFTDFDAAPTGRGRPKRKRRSRSPLGFILALIGVLTVVSCGICIVVTVISVPNITTFVQQVVLTVTYQPDFGTLAALATPGAQAALLATASTSNTLPNDLQMQGSVENGQVIQNTVVPYNDDGWTYNAHANQHVVIEVDAIDPKLDPHLYLYDPSGKLIAENDDIDGSTNRNSRLDTTLPSAGQYTIRISAFADGGAYKLTLTSGT